MPPDSNEVKRWVEKADHDRIAAADALTHTPPITDVAAFHCQQAVEKLLKAFLVHQREPFERIHDLVELLATCTRCDPAFEALRSCVEPLTPYAVRFRYPGPADPSVEQATAALEAVHVVWQFVLDRLPKE